VTGETAERRRFALALAAILLAAALVRLGHWWAVRELPFVAALALDSAEYDRWAQELASGDWLGREPFFQAPLYPYALGALYAVAGRSLDLVYLAQIALGLAGLVFVALAARRLLSEPHALVAAGLGALYLPLVFHEVQVAKEGPAVAVTGALLYALTRARATQTTTAWLAAGALAGLLALLRENALLVVPFLLPLVVVPDAERVARSVDWRRTARAGIGFGAGLLLALAPVAARNAALGGGVLPTTSQGGVNFWIGNNPDADGTYRPLVPGKQIPALERSEAERLAEQALGRPLRAAEVSRYWAGRALDWAAREPSAWARLQLRKLALYAAPYEWPDVVDYAWLRARSPALRLPGLEWGALVVLALVGVALERRRITLLAPVVLFEAGWLVATVAFFLFARYRLPAVPGLLILASIPLVALAERWRAGGGRERSGRPRRWVTFVFALAAVALVAGTRLAAPPARLDLVEFNLGRLAQEAGELDAAAAHYRRALDADPHFFSAAMNLGVLAARAGRSDEAVGWLERATALEPRSDDAWANLGGALLARGELDSARAALERALALHPEHPAATANLALLERRTEAR
jgi:tetratricopeptide (TPR) repeat protein